MTREEIFEIMRPIILLTTGVPHCYLATQNRPSCDGDYCIVEPKLNPRCIGQLTKSKFDDTTAATDITLQYITECKIIFYRGPVMQYAERMPFSNFRSDVSEMLQRANLGWNRFEGPHDLRALQSAQWEPRAQLSVYLMYVVRTPTVEVNKIDNVEVIIRDEKTRILEEIKIEDN